MRKGRSSLTAAAVAAARALASSTRAAVLDPQDREAERMLPRPLSLLVQALREGDAGRGWLAAAASSVSLGMVDHVALRSAIIDRLVGRAVEAGTRQVVIVGAGLDTRAYRLEALRHASVYEVDHPDSQREKLARTAGLPRVAGSLSHVSLDLSAGGLRARLADAGHRDAEPSLFIAEGLVPYLECTAITSMLREIALASADGSVLLLTYVTPDLVWLRHARAFVLASMRLIGEPFHSTFSRQQMRETLETAGFELQQDTDTHDWARELCEHPSRQPLIAYERLAVARKAANP
ncbi:MAG: class I SAM-dependent methyltransferase [Polyangiales bacterium]